MYSAIKLDGQPLYKRARLGQVIERPPRSIEISSLELLSFAPPFAGFRVVCSRGTYVRTLADDIGGRLGCGAALKELRRTASGPFGIERAVTLDVLEESARHGTLADLTLSPREALGHLPEIPLDEAGIALVRHGRSPVLSVSAAALLAGCRDGGLVRLTHDRMLIAVASCQVSAATVQQIRLKRVFL
jgi:tRNA pseudouridine55 synthase